mmetsp:Transcript_119891/g.217801  ORF Transcript_119891/g.217801 Transcript_119891/m.217801 type:complete len:227 (+) Transcript_119891:2-682(+)
MMFVWKRPDRAPKRHRWASFSQHSGRVTRVSCSITFRGLALDSISIIGNLLLFRLLFWQHGCLPRFGLKDVRSILTRLAVDKQHDAPGVVRRNVGRVCLQPFFYLSLHFLDAHIRSDLDRTNRDLATSTIINVNPDAAPFGLSFLHASPLLVRPLVYKSLLAGFLGLRPCPHAASHHVVDAILGCNPVRDLLSHIVEQLWQENPVDGHALAVWECHLGEVLHSAGH